MVAFLAWNKQTKANKYNLPRTHAREDTYREKIHIKYIIYNSYYTDTFFFILKKATEINVKLY